MLTTMDYRTRLLLTYEPSHFQEAIYDWVENGEGDGVVEAVAGSGKTATLVACAQLVRNGLFVAFNRHIADELARKLKGTTMIAKTVHSVGRGVCEKHLEYVLVEGRKYHWIITDYLIRQLGMVDKSVELVDARRLLRKLVDLVRLNLIDPTDTEAVTALCIHHDIKINGLARHLPALLAEGEAKARNGRHLIDFTDMIYLPVAWGLPVPQFEWVFVDECQDLNRCQLEFVLMCRREDGRMLFVGDRNQAIYGFAGADAESFLNIIARTGATMLPLSICYRCPTSVLNLIRVYDHLAHVENRPDAPSGVVRYINNDVIHTEVVPGDLILCRMNAPLIALCIDFIGRGVQARVKGRDIGRMLCDVITAVTRLGDFSYDHFLEYLDDWRIMQYKFLEAEDASESAYERVDDKALAVATCFKAWPEVYLRKKYAEVPGAPDPQFRIVYSDGEVSRDEWDLPKCLCAEIQSLFFDDRPSVWLSTIHKAKGLENERIFILAPGSLPLVWPEQQPWEYQQEINLLYVAYTRTQAELIFIT